MRGVEDAAPYTGDGGAVQAGGVEPRPYAVKNDCNFLPPAGGKLCEAFLLLQKMTPSSFHG